MAVFTAIGASLFGAGTFLAGLTAAGLQVAAGIAINLMAKSVSGSSETDKPGFGVQGRLQAGGTISRSIMLGYGATAGSLVYANTWGAANQADNAYLTQVICLGDYPVNSLAQTWVNGDLVTLDGTPHASYGSPVTDYRKNGVDHLWVKFYDGTQTTADTFLTGTVASAERPFGSTRVGTGCPYVIVTALVNETLFSGFPTLKFALNGAKLYDPSKDTSVGGSGTQRWATPSTWGGDGDGLPAVQIYNLLRGVTYGGKWFYGLQGLPAARLPDADWIAQINKCRATVTGPDGTEATYRSGGEVTVDAPLADAIEALLTSCQGRLVEIDGTYKLRVGEPGSSVFSFDDDDIISTQEQSFTPFFGLADTINGISARHPSPAEGWNQKVAPPLYNAAYEALDGDRRLMADVSLDFVPYRGQVQRLMKSALAEARRARRHTFVLPPDAFILEPGDIIDWTSTRNGYVGKLFRVDGIVDRVDLDVMVDITEVDPSDYDWDQAVDYKTPSDGPVSRVTPAPQAIVDWSVVAATVNDAAGNPRRPSMRISWNGAQPDVRAVEYQVRLASSGAVITSGEITDVATGQALLPAVFLPNTAYEVRGRYVPISQRDTTWSSWLSVTTDNVGFGFDDLSSTVRALQDWVTVRVRDIDEQMQLATSLGADQDAANFEDRKYLLSELTIGDDTVNAAWKEGILVALGMEGQALADAITAVDAASGDMSAGVVTRMTALASPGGGWSRYGVQVRASTGDSWPAATASLFLEAKTDGTSRIIFQAAETYFLDNLGNIVGMFTGSGAAFNKAYIKDLEAANLAAGAIIAGKIAAGAIDTASLFVNGVIITDLIAANAVSVLGHFSHDGMKQAASGGTVSILSGAITADGGEVLISFQSFAESSGDREVWFIVNRNGTQIFRKPGSYVFNSGGTAEKQYGTSVTFKDTPGIGSTTYELVGENVGPAGTTQFRYSALTVTNLKK